MEYLIRERWLDEPFPYDLLVLSDVNRALIDGYLLRSRLYLMEVANQVVGVGVWQVYDEGVGEILNIAIAPDYQKKGLGKVLLQSMADAAQGCGVRRLLIATGNPSIRQIALYQQQGFDLIDIDRNYFLRHYPEPIWENGIQCKHQLIFQKQLG
jgi:aminoglycoside 6'-N-acetyltransferase I